MCNPFYILVCTFLHFIVYQHTHPTLLCASHLTLQRAPAYSSYTLVCTNLPNLHFSVHPILHFSVHQSTHPLLYCTPADPSYNLVCTNQPILHFRVCTNLDHCHQSGSRNWSLYNPRYKHTFSSAPLSQPWFHHHRSHPPMAFIM